MRIPEQTITEISERTDIVALIGEYVTLTQKGNRYWGLCPFHLEKTPSFSVTPEKNIFYCFGCNKGGSVYNFLMEIEHISFVESVELAAKRVGISITVEKDKSNLRREAYCELYKRVSGSFHHILQKSESASNARAYLKNRKITKELQELFTIGYAPKDKEWLFGFLSKKSYSADFLSESGLFSKGKKAYFADRLMFPILNSRNEVLAFGGRALSDWGPKYLNSPETAYYHKSNNLYGLHCALSDIKKMNSFFLVEGYLDVIAMHAAGVPNCVAPLGTALTESQAKMMHRYAEKVIIFFDSDNAGIKATLRAIDILESCEFQIEVISVETAKDPAEIYEKQGVDALKNVLKCSINSFQFIIKRAKKNYTISTPSGKEDFFGFIVPYLSKIRSSIRRESYISMTAEALGTSAEAVKQDVVRFQHKQSRYKSRKADQGDYPEKKFTEQLLFKNKELFLMLVIALSPEYFQEVRKYIKTEDIFDDNARALYIVLEECYRNDEHTIESVLKRLDNEDVRELINKNASTDAFTAKTDDIINVTLREVRIEHLKRKREKIVQQLRNCEKQNSDDIQIRELSNDSIYLTSEIEKLKGKLV